MSLLGRVLCCIAIRAAVRRSLISAIAEAASSPRLPARSSNSRTITARASLLKGGRLERVSVVARLPISPANEIGVSVLVSIV